MFGTKLWIHRYLSHLAIDTANRFYYNMHKWVLTTSILQHLVSHERQIVGHLTSQGVSHLRPINYILIPFHD